MPRMLGVYLLCALAVLGAGPVRANGPYVNRKYHFGLLPPPNWVEKAHPDALAIFLEPDGTRPASPRPRRESNEEFLARLKEAMKTPVRTGPVLRANIVLTARMVGGMSLEQFAREKRAEAAKMKTYRILGEKSRRLGGSPALEHSIRIGMPGEPVVQLREVFCVRNGCLLTLALAAPANSFAKYSAAFDKTLASFFWQQ